MNSNTLAYIIKWATSLTERKLFFKYIFLEKSKQQDIDYL